MFTGDFLKLPANQYFHRPVFFTWALLSTHSLWTTLTVNMKSKSNTIHVVLLFVLRTVDASTIEGVIKSNDLFLQCRQLSDGSLRFVEFSDPSRNNFSIIDASKKWQQWSKCEQHFYFLHDGRRKGKKIWPDNILSFYSFMYCTYWITYWKNLWLLKLVKKNLSV